MKKTLILFAVLFVTVLSLNAETRTINLDGKRTDDKFKLGVALGYPTGITAGLRTSEHFELNGVVATHYSDFTVGIIPMFTLANLQIADEVFPLSIGPAGYLTIDWFGGIDIDILGNVRVEYSFKSIPLNLFLEGGAGIKLDLGSNQLIKPQGSGALGIRYIF